MGIISPHTALLICNGDPPSAAFAARCRKRCELLVATDGGANLARAFNLIPDVIIGDLDSITTGTREFFSQVRMIHVGRQDNTDLEKTLDFLVGQQITDVTIIAATGKRLDHTLGNLSVIWNYIHALAMMFVSDDWVAVPMRGRLRVTAPVGSTVSLLPFGACRGITLSGLQYPLANATMHVGQIGVSNVSVSSRFSIDVRDGRMLAMILAPPDRVRIIR